MSVEKKNNPNQFSWGSPSFSVFNQHKFMYQYLPVCVRVFVYLIVCMQMEHTSQSVPDKIINRRIVKLISTKATVRFESKNSHYTKKNMCLTWIFEQNLRFRLKLFRLFLCAHFSRVQLGISFHSHFSAKCLRLLFEIVLGRLCTTCSEIDLIDAKKENRTQNEWMNHRFVYLACEKSDATEQRSRTEARKKFQ